MSNVRLFEKPLKLNAGQTGFFRVKNSLLVITIVSDIDGVVSYTFPLKPDDRKVYQAPKDQVFMPLHSLATLGQLTLAKTP